MFFTCAYRARALYSGVVDGDDTNPRGTMTRTEHLKSIVGTTASLWLPAHNGPHGPMAVAVEVLHFKTTYGRPRYLVRPVAGTGSAWVSADRIVGVDA